MRLLARLFPAAIAVSLTVATGAVSAQTELPDIGNPAAASITVDEERQIGEMITKQLRDQGQIGPLPIEPLAQIILAAIDEAVLAVAHADDPATMLADMAEALTALIGGLTRYGPVEDHSA